MKTDALIDMLARDAGPVPRALAARRLSPAAAAGLLVSALIAIAWFGAIPAQMFATAVPWTKMAYAGALALAAGWWTARLSRPAAPIALPRRVTVLVLLAMVVVGGFSLASTPAGARLDALLGESWPTCPWILLGVVVPAAGRMAIDRAVPIPSGADIIMTQREAVNDAWDLPKATTMTAFVERHPQWAAHTAVERPFEWKWYFAFQQVGDQKAQALSEAYTTGRLKRDQLAGWLAVLAPPVLLERALQALARSDLRSALAYEAKVRAFHAKLREFYYPKLFRDERFEPAALEALPVFHAQAPDG